jgi:purine-binding chemotaxis protein CheW
MSENSQSTDYLSFEIDEELFGVNLTNLNQIIESPELTNVPKSSDLLEGIIYHNDELLPIVNFQRWLNLDAEVKGSRSNILVLELQTDDGSIEVGLMVDKVLEVVHFEQSDIEKVPKVGDHDTDYIRGIARYLEKFIMLIDIDNLFTENELSAIKESRESKTEKTLEEIALEDKFINIYLTFSLGEEKLAVDANKVVEILDVPSITPIPGSDVLLAGVINIRGSILPVVDTRLKFNIDVSENEKITTVMVVDVDIDGEEMSVGAIVDSVTDIIEIADEDINSAVSLDLPFNPSYLKGVAKVKDTFIQLMNSNKVFELNTIEK